MENAPSPAAADYRGRTFGSYTILEEISRGAMGVVYKARQHHLERVVALKVLIAGEMATEAQVARFRREAQAAARLRHPAIVPIHEVGVFEGKHYYTMDYIEGRDLSDLIRSGDITTRRALDIAAQVAIALDYAHRRGVIHRDIKPSNIMIDADDRIHIMDFGLAKQVDSDTKFTRTGTTIGTPAYMPPEQASGESRRVDHRADIYSLGAVLYEMLTSRPPFTGDTMMNTLMRVLNEEPVPPKRLNPRIHRDIQTIVLKAMEKSPERRYPTMRALADDVRHFIAGESITARPAGLLYRAWKILKRHHSAVFATAAVLIIGLTAVAIVVDIRRQSEVRIAAARETGKREGAKAAERESERQEKPTVKTVFEDTFEAPSLGKSWVIESGPWRVGDGQHLDVTTAPLAAVHTKRTFTGNVKLTFEASLPPMPNGSAQTQPLIGCYLGSEWRRSYRFSFGTRSGPDCRLVLMNRRQEVAESECPPLKPATWYRVTLVRTPVGVRVGIENDAGDPSLRLAYNEVTLPLQLPREFAAGLFTEHTHLRVRRVAVEQEFPPAKLSPLKAAEGLFRDGNIAEAQSQYQKIAQGYEGTYVGLAALLGMARCAEAERRYRQAGELYPRIEALAPRIEHDELPELVQNARLHRFFASASINNYADAVQALARIASGDGTVDEAWVWHLPRYIDQMLNNRAYDEALSMLRLSIFGSRRETLYTLTQALRAYAMEGYLATRVRHLADGFCNNGHYEKVRAVYRAYPSRGLADAFARAADHATRDGKPDEALSLLAFCHQEQMQGAALSKAGVALAGSFCKAGAYSRVSELYQVFPEPKLEPVFLRAIGEATAAGKLDEALPLVQESLKNFPADSRNLVGANGPVVQLGRAFVKKGDVLKPITLHGLFDPAPDDPAFVALFVEASRAAIEAEQTDEARRLLAYARVHFGVLNSSLAAVAARLVALHDAAGDYEEVALAYVAYPNDTLAPTVVKAIRAATAADQLHEALVILGHYARRRQAIPTQAVQELADHIATLEPTDDETVELVAEYGRACELYDSPVARSSFFLALGDAWLRTGHLREALPQYDAAAGPEGTLRAACLALELGDPEEAGAQWERLRELSEDGTPNGAIATFMIGETTVDEFAKAAVAAKLAPSLAAYLTGLRLWTEFDDTAADSLVRAAAGAPAWFTPLARRPRSPRPTPGLAP